jgi:hypothetical protein
MQLLAAVLALGLLIACGKPAPTPEPTREVVIDATPTPVVVDAPPPPPIVEDAPIAIDAATGAVTEVPGTGKCKVDTDCELSSYQAGCCVQGCEPYARNKRELHREMAAEEPTCEKFRKSGKPCPPPAPCPLQTHQILAAKCVKNSCYTVKQKLPAKP